MFLPFCQPQHLIFPLHVELLFPNILFPLFLLSRFDSTLIFTIALLLTSCLFQNILLGVAIQMPITQALYGTEADGSLGLDGQQSTQ